MMERCDKYYRYAKWYDIFIFFYIVLILVLGVFLIKKYKPKRKNLQSKPTNQIQVTTNTKKEIIQKGGE